MPARQSLGLRLGSDAVDYFADNPSIVNAESICEASASWRTVAFWLCNADL